jgi:hypothetical protein
MLVVLSQHYFASDFTMRELTQAIYRDAAGRKGIVVPVVVGECDLAGSLLGPLVHIDLTGAGSEEVAKHLLLDGLREKGPPTSAPPFPGRRRDTGAPKPAFPGGTTGTRSGAAPLGLFHDVPMLPPNYLARPEEVQPLRDALLDPGGRSVGITAWRSMSVFWAWAGSASRCSPRLSRAMGTYAWPFRTA